MAEAITYRQKFNEREVMLLLARLHRLQPEKWQNRNVPRALPMRAAFVRTLTMSRDGTNHCPTFRLKCATGDVEAYCSGRCRPRQRYNSLNNKEITTIIRRNGVSLLGQPYTGNRTPTS